MARKICLLVIMALFSCFFNGVSWSRNPKEDLEFYDYNTSYDKDSEDLVNRLIGMKGGGEEVDILIAKFAYYTDGCLAEDMTHALDRAIHVRPNFIRNTYKSKYFDVVIRFLYYKIIYDYPTRDYVVKPQSVKNIITEYIDGLPEMVSGEEKELLQNMLMQYHQRLKDLKLSEGDFIGG